MVWKSRQDETPPPQFFADVIGYLRQAFPEAELTREALGRLAPHLLREWRNGQSARNAAKATCSCDGRQITVSPAAEVHVPRRAVLPPRNALRGALFGIDELRERREVGKLRVKAAVEERHAEYQAGQLSRLQAEHRALVAAGKSPRAARLAAKIATTEAAIRAHQEHAARLRQEADRLAQERGYWTPPSAEELARKQAAEKRMGKKQPAVPADPVRAPASQRRPAKPVPAVSSSQAAKPGRRSGACGLCAEEAPPAPDLSALVDQFVEASLKDEEA